MNAPLPLKLEHDISANKKNANYSVVYHWIKKLASMPNVDITKREDLIIDYICNQGTLYSDKWNGRSIAELLSLLMLFVEFQLKEKRILVEFDGTNRILRWLKAMSSILQCHHFLLHYEPYHARIQKMIAQVVEAFFLANKFDLAAQVAEVGHVLLSINPHQFIMQVKDISTPTPSVIMKLVELKNNSCKVVYEGNEI